MAAERLLHEGDCSASLGSRVHLCYRAYITGIRTVTGWCDEMPFAGITSTITTTIFALSLVESDG
jgi:hypothetical protein